MLNLTTIFAELELKNPLIIGSSGLTDDVEKIKSLEEAGAGAVVVKSIFEEEIIAEINMKCRQMKTKGLMYPETLEFYRHGLDINKTSNYLNFIKELKNSVEIPVIASINCVSPKIWTYFPRQVERAGADAIELNLFVLPSDFTKPAEDIERLYLNIIEEVLDMVYIPVIIKISPYFSNLGLMIQRLSYTGVSGMVLFNRLYKPDIDIQTEKMVHAQLFSKPEDYLESLRWINIMSKRVNADLCASTGIFSYETVIKHILSGAPAVQLVSALYKKGLSFIPEILNKIKEWMDEKGYSTLEDFKGKLSQPKDSNPAALNRVAFMNEYR